jgi:selenocysteine-specific elongation factor
LSGDEAQAALQELLETQQARQLKVDLYISDGGWVALCNRISRELDAYHKTNPLKIGLPREELKHCLDTRTFNLIIEQAVQENIIAATGSALHAPSFAIAFKPNQQKAIDILIGKFTVAPWNAPSSKDAEQVVGAEVLSALIDLGRLSKLSEDVLLLAETYRWGVEEVRAYLIEHKTITVAQVRDLFNTSRKYALALMEYLDAQGITKRVGDERSLR